MTTKPMNNMDSKTRHAIDDLKGMIAARYPDASFDVVLGDDPPGIYLDTTLDIDDVDEVLDVVRDELFHLQVEEGLPIYVIPLDLKTVRVTQPTWHSRPFSRNSSAPLDQILYPERSQRNGGRTSKQGSSATVLAMTASATTATCRFIRCSTGDWPSIWQTSPAAGRFRKTAGWRERRTFRNSFARASASSP